MLGILSLSLFYDLIPQCLANKLFAAKSSLDSLRQKTKKEGTKKLTQMHWIQRLKESRELA